MMFCPKCKSLLTPKLDAGKRIMACSCGFKDKKPEPSSFKESVKKTEDIAVIQGEEEPLPLTDGECPKCKHDKAYYWTLQTRASDEAETKFLKCQKCKHVWRDYS